LEVLCQQGVVDDGALDQVVAWSTDSAPGRFQAGAVVEVVGEHVEQDLDAERA
jgi:hypothetical protein